MDWQAISVALGQVLRRQVEHPELPANDFAQPRWTGLVDRRAATLRQRFWRSQRQGDAITVVSISVRMFTVKISDTCCHTNRSSWSVQQHST